MRENLTMIVVEEPDGKIGVQLFDNPETAVSSFAQFNGRPGDKPSRASLVLFDFKERKADIQSKDLPVPVLSPEERPDMYRLGEGPVWFDKEEEEEDGSTKS